MYAWLQHLDRRWIFLLMFLAVALPILFQRLPGLRFANRPRYRDAFHFHGLEALAARWDQGAPTRR